MGAAPVLWRDSYFERNGKFSGRAEIKDFEFRSEFAGRISGSAVLWRQKLWQIKVTGDSPVLWNETGDRSHDQLPKLKMCSSVAASGNSIDNGICSGS